MTTAKGERQKTESTPDLPASPSPAGDQPHLQAYNLVVERAALASVRLIDLRFKVGGDLAERPTGRLKASAFYNATAGDHSFNTETGHAALTLNCSAGAKHGKKMLVDCKAKFLVMYEGLQGCDEQAVGRFLARVGRFAGYPYFRSLFSVLTWNAEAGMPPLPVLRERPRKPKDAKSSSAVEVGKSDPPN